MKRIIFGILVLVTGWQLVQVPSVNSALFAFLTLGINPFTNHVLSTPYLIAVLFAIGLAGILLFFNRALSDFFGGLFDWLTRAERHYVQPFEEAATPMLGLDPTPAKATIDVMASPQVSTSLPSFSSFAASVRATKLPRLVLPDMRPKIAVISKSYDQILERLRSRLRSPEAPVQGLEQVGDDQDALNLDLAPEMAEVLAIFEKLAIDTMLSEPLEAEVVEPVIPRKPSAILSGLKNALEKTERALGITKQRAHRNLISASRKANQFGSTSGRKTRAAARSTGNTISRSAKTLARTIYRGALLIILGMLLAADKVMHVLTVSLLYVGHVSRLVYQKSMRGLMLTAISITLGMFAVGRGIDSGARAVGHGLAALCRAMYWVLSNGVMLAILGAGYTLFIFSIVSFMVWELLEPYARKLDKWLGDRFGDDDSMTEIAKVGHEMSRTLSQWYRELRGIKHGTQP